MPTFEAYLGAGLIAAFGNPMLAGVVILIASEKIGIRDSLSTPK